MRSSVGVQVGDGADWRLGVRDGETAGIRTDGLGIEGTVAEAAVAGVESTVIPWKGVLLLLALSGTLLSLLFGAPVANRV